MDVKDRERLALSTGIALVGYAIIFVLLMGLQWPPAAPFRTISPPVSVYVNLEGGSLSEVVGTQPEPASPQRPAAEGRAFSTASGREGAQSSVSPQSVASAQEARPAPQPQPSLSAPAPSQATAIPRRPDIPQSMTSSGGGTPTGRAGGTGPQSQSGGPVTGPQSAKPGVNYPPGADQGSLPPQGSGGAGTQTAQGQAQTYYGTTTQAPAQGSIFNQDLAAKAGTASAPQGSTSNNPNLSSPSGAAASTGAPATTGGAAGGGAGGAGSAGSQTSPSSNLPTIDWKGDSTPRTVAYQPEQFKVPPQYLNDIPPAVTLKISFTVAPFGNVNVLNITPPLLYPGLETALEAWMERWRFQPIGGNQVAQGTLQYVIKADTAR